MTGAAFLLKKLLTQLLMPVPLAVLLILASLILCLRTGRRGRPARRWPAILPGAAGLLLLVVAADGVVADALVRPLESRYPACLPAPDAAPIAGIAYVVVLGAGHVSDPEIPLSSRVNDAAVVRLVEGIRLQRLHPGSRLVVSGGRVFDDASSARLMADLAVTLGVASDEIIAVEEPLDTASEARLIAPITGGRPFLLVTCATHMPRAMALFQQQGVCPIPAPTHHLARRREAAGVSRHFPRAANLAKTERAIHETVGLLWARLRGQA